MYVIKDILLTFPSAPQLPRRASSRLSALDLLLRRFVHFIPSSLELLLRRFSRVLAKHLYLYRAEQLWSQLGNDGRGRWAAVGWCRGLTSESVDSRTRVEAEGEQICVTPVVSLEIAGE